MAAEPTQNSILRISDEKTAQLIDLYRNEECLWNTHSPFYKDRDQRIAATERIAKALNVPNFDARHVVVKFKNLRNSYCQELKKIGHSILQAGKQRYKPTVFWFDKMNSFLRPHLQPTKPSARVLLQVNEDGSSTSRDSLEVSCDVEIKREPSAEHGDWQALDNSEDEQQEPEIHFVEVYDENERSASQTLRDDVNPPRKRPRIEDIHTLTETTKKTLNNSSNDPTDSLLKSISSSLESIVERRDDPCELFGRYVASLLRTMPRARALALQPRIVALIASSAISDGRVSQSDENVL